MRRRASAQADPLQGFVDRAAATQDAAIEDELVRTPRIKRGRSVKLRKRRAIAWPRARQCEVGVEAAILGLQPSPNRFGFNDLSQPGHLPGPGAQADPDHPRQPAPLEASQLAQPQLKPRWTIGIEPFRDFLCERSLELTQEPDGEVEIARGRPAEFGRQARASLQVRVERLAVRFGQRQPEKSADLQRPRRVFFCQLTGAQELGAEGRQPNCELTESMPAARLSI